MYLFVKATVLSALQSFCLYWLFVLKIIANVGVEPTKLGLRLACSTD